MKREIGLSSSREPQLHLHSISDFLHPQQPAAFIFTRTLASGDDISVGIPFFLDRTPTANHNFDSTVALISGLIQIFDDAHKLLDEMLQPETK
ncbi:hypothetical protein LXL04_009474 [Taraxacum kok-saghyz]